MKHKRKIITAAGFLIIFSYLIVAITGLLKDIEEKKTEDLELKTKIIKQEDLYQKLLLEQQLIDKMDPEYLEELARKLGMLKEGEILFEERKE